jgi:hypothetical protein
MKYENTFTHDNHVYSLDKVRFLIRKTSVTSLNIKDLIWILKFDKPNENRIAKAKFRHPLLVAHWKGRLTVIDGLHRLEKYRRQGYKEVPCKIVSDEILRKALITKRGLFVGMQRYKKM